MRRGLAPGDTFPDYELPDHEHARRSLSQIQGDNPMILTLARGAYCPKEHRQHLELAAFWGRPSTADLWNDLRAVTREIRPDWDLNTPGLRERWDAGDRAPFYGWASASNRHQESAGVNA